MAWANLIRGFGGGDDYYGRKPVVPQYPTATEIMREGTGANIANFGDASKLADKTNTFNQEQILKMLRTAIPGYDEMMSQGSSAIGSMLRGEVSKDIQNQVARGSAERSLMGGYGGSGMAKNLEARDLGLSSLQVTQQGLNAADRWISSARANATPMNFGVENMFLNPAQSMVVADMRFQRDLMQEKIVAGPDPVKRGAFDSEMALMGMILSAYGGGAGYTGAASYDYQGGGGGGGGGGRGGGGGLGGGGWAYNSYTPSSQLNSAPITSGMSYNVNIGGGGSYGTPITSGMSLGGY